MIWNILGIENSELRSSKKYEKVDSSKMEPVNAKKAIEDDDSSDCRVGDLKNLLKHCYKQIATIYSEWENSV